MNNREVLKHNIDCEIVLQYRYLISDKNQRTTSTNNYYFNGHLNCYIGRFHPICMIYVQKYMVNTVNRLDYRQDHDLPDGPIAWHAYDAPKSVNHLRVFDVQLNAQLHDPASGEIDFLFSTDNTPYCNIKVLIIGHYINMLD